MIEYIIVGLIVAIALFAGGRSLWRTWTGQDTNGCRLHKLQFVTGLRCNVPATIAARQGQQFRLRPVR